MSAGRSATTLDDRPRITFRLPVRLSCGVHGAACGPRSSPGITRTNSGTCRDVAQDPGSRVGHGRRLDRVALARGLGREGRAVRLAILDDLRVIDEVELVATLDPRFAHETGPWSTVVVVAGPRGTLTRLAERVRLYPAHRPGDRRHAGHAHRACGGFGGTTLGSSPVAITLAADKRRLASFLVKKGMRVPTEWYNRARARRAFVRLPGGRQAGRRGGVARHLPPRPVPVIARRPRRGPAALIIQPYYPGVSMGPATSSGPTGGSTCWVSAGRRSRCVTAGSPIAAAGCPDRPRSGWASLSGPCRP